MILSGLPAAGEVPGPVVVVGAGPAGLIAALELRRRGVEVDVLAGGLDGFDAGFQDLAEAEIVEVERHGSAPTGCAFISERSLPASRSIRRVAGSSGLPSKRWRGVASSCGRGRSSWPAAGSRRPACCWRRSVRCRCCLAAPPDHSAN